jgi:hypothetical protein
MIDNTALQTKTARAVVRKAGLRPVSGEAVADRVSARMVVDTYVLPTVQAANWQWRLDLTGYTQIRFISPSERTLYLYYSEATTTDVNPGDYQVFRATRVSTGATNVAISSSLADRIGSFQFDGIKWFEIPVTLRKDLRLSLSDSLTSWRLDSPTFSATDKRGFAVGVQVF